ncbi:MAG TPA: hypothetical protein VG269_22235 [Tepidisphaeraceae bacterium]|jgi:hypothetical protein|nr:hypothetical protein [Tepidisphaeraceae bacterium]
MDPSQHSIREVISLIGSKPGMYVTTPSLECLSAFLNGWFLANGDRVSDAQVWQGFLTHLGQKLRFDESVSFERAIRFRSRHTFEAYNLFFEYFDEYCSQRVEEKNTDNPVAPILPT